MSLWRIFRTFLLLGSIGFGGAMPMLALVHQEVVERKKWIDPSQFAEGVTLGQTLPGPIAVDVVTHIGYRLRGWKGATVATCAFILPSFTLMILLGLLYFHYGMSLRAGGTFRGIGAAVIGLIMAACLHMGKAAVKDLASFFLPISSFLLLFTFRAPILLILGWGALVGILSHIHQRRKCP